MAESNMDKNLRETFGKAVGGRVTAVRALTEAELKELQLRDLAHPGNPGIVIILDNGYSLIPMADPEGNGPGWLELAEASDLTISVTAPVSPGVARLKVGSSVRVLTGAERDRMGYIHRIHADGRVLVYDVPAPVKASKPGNPPEDFEWGAWLAQSEIEVRP